MRDSLLIYKQIKPFMFCLLQKKLKKHFFLCSEDTGGTFQQTFGLWTLHLVL